MGAEDGHFGAEWKRALNRGALMRGALDLLFPRETLDGEAAVGAQGLSADVWSKIHFLDAPVCDGCAQPFEFDPGPGVRCPACTARPRAFDAARAACVYDEVSRDPILKLKHADRTDLAPMFARWLSRAAAELLEEADAIAPVPLHRLRLLGRRYNQSAEVARPLARLSGVSYLADALVRRRATESQAGKSGAHRRRNLAAAFRADRRRVEGRRILVIDDVMTTGATLEGCARALKAAGAARVDVAVIARVKEAPGLTI
jgi:ComF family protein